ncbi:NAD(P)-dependent oxidoreductase [Actinocorallia sp. A-T 12471]|uniref:NAD(P)-dependent oxidoreductase n=1 Tax=Actinocorallia sp. A-T 12471 TaxID=3089813 RepID=UPI0029CF87E5|nr:NAD(P)H-binding protein [Actinocorallia sp. A-T 12471]MDX6741191.1 NAD(P)H-binding protein [Actinocorallia sp. A-T 12471]
MSRITVLGGTGYAGSAIAREAAARGHDVVGFSRTAPAEPVDGVTPVTGSALVRADLERAVKGADVIVVALAPSGELQEGFVALNAEIADLALRGGTRLGVVGGAGSLRVAADGPKVLETPQFPEAFRQFARASDDVLTALRDSDPALDWFVLSPALGFGAYAPGEPRGTFRIGGDLLLTDEQGGSEISGADYAKAFVDEIEAPAHRRTRFTVAY